MKCANGVLMKLNSKRGNDFELDLKGISENLLHLAKNNDIGAAYFDANSVICTFKISSEYSNNTNRHFFRYVFDYDEDGYSLLYDELDFFKYLKKEIKDDRKSQVIMNLFFDIRSEFSKFHSSWTEHIPQDKPRLLFCGIFCDTKDKRLIDSSLELLYSSFTFKDSYEDSIPKIDIEGRTVFLIDIAAFYHMTDANIFSVKKYFANKLTIMKGEKYESFGKNDFFAQDDPQRNPYHPDALSVEQKIRMGVAHQKTEEWVAKNGGDIYTS